MALLGIHLLADGLFVEDFLGVDLWALALLQVAKQRMDVNKIKKVEDDDNCFFIITMG